MGPLLRQALANAPAPATVAGALACAAAGGPSDPEVSALGGELGITEILHFTTNLGLIGVLGMGQLLSRERLPTERLLEYVYKPNTPFRKDPAWAPFVNLSISQVNDWMFSTSTNRRWGEDIFWVVLSFGPEILAHPGVVFTTTNNIYPRVRRATGAPGMAAMFGPKVIGRYETEHDRVGKAENQTTDRQAEVLYPHAVSTAHLQRVYVASAEHDDAIAGIFGGIPDAVEVPVSCAPEVFR
jgi:hypothetical protein